MISSLSSSLPHPLPETGRGFTQAEVDKTYSTIARRIVPLALVGYVVAYIDRVNVGYAKLQFVEDLGFSEAVYGFGAGLFFIGYMLFEIPSNLYLERVGARRTLTRIMVLWGLASAGTAFISSPAQYYVMRFLLGAAEAGFFPGIILYLSYWFPPARRSRVTSLFTAGGTVAGVIGSPLSGWLLSLDGLHGLEGWQIVFIYEGVPAVLLGLLAYRYMDDRPADATWLTPRQKDIVALNEATASATGGRRHAEPPHGISRPHDLHPRDRIRGGDFRNVHRRPVGAHPAQAVRRQPVVERRAPRTAVCGGGDRDDGAQSQFGPSPRAALALRPCDWRGRARTVPSESCSGQPRADGRLLTVVATGAWSSLPVFWTIPAAYLSE